MVTLKPLKSFGEAIPELADIAEVKNVVAVIFQESRENFSVKYFGKKSKIFFFLPVRISYFS
jgi:hypothetical protein